MAMVLYGGDELVAILRNIAKKVPDHARRTMNNGADKIVERAKLFTPVETHALENSIHKVVSYESNRRLAIDIVAGEDLDYASLIHENYESLGVGPGTAAKRQANPDVYIGSHFLTRAVEEQEPKLEKMMIETIVSVVSGEGK